MRTLGVSITLLVFALLLGGCEKRPRTGFGYVEHMKDADTRYNDVARALGMDLAKFRYEFEPGEYETQVWLESLDKGTTTPNRLTHGRGAGDRSSGGDIVFSMMDPATTQSERGRVWRVGISRVENDFSMTDTRFIDNPFDHAAGGQVSSVTPEHDFQLDEDVILMTWGVGLTSGSSALATGRQADDVAHNDRTVYLKMKVTPRE